MKREDLLRHAALGIRKVTCGTEELAAETRRLVPGVPVEVNTALGVNGYEIETNAEIRPVLELDASARGPGIIGHTTGDATPDMSVTATGVVSDRSPVMFERGPIGCPSCRAPMKYAADAKEGETVAITCGTPGCMWNVEPTPPLCPSCTARSEQSRANGKLGFALCGACADAAVAFEVARMDRAPAHPAPWRWVGEPGLDDHLADANGRMLIWPSNMSGIAADDGVRELVAAAPEMAALLRESLPVREATCGYTCVGPLCANDEPCWEHRRQALVARLPKEPA